MPKIFKIGDRVRVIIPGEGYCFQMGQEFIVKATQVNRASAESQSVELTGLDGWHWSSRFELIPGEGELDLSKPLEVKGGSLVKLLSTDANGDFPIVVQTVSGDVRVFNRKGESKYGCYSPIQNVPEKPKEIVKYINFYHGGVSGTYSSRANADLGASSNRVGCQKVVLIEGTFDS